MTQWQAQAVCDGGDLDCGSGLLLIIRKYMDPLSVGEILEIKSRERSVAEDLPAWCRMVGHLFLGFVPGEGGYTRYFIQKGDGGSSSVRSQTRELAEDLEAARGYQWSARIRGGQENVRVYARNHTLEAGKPADFSAQVAAPSAVDYLLTALGACLTAGFQSHAARRGVTVDQLEFTVKGKLGNVLFHMGLEDEGNPGFQQISGTLYVSSPEPEEVIQEVWQTTLARSPVYHSLRQEIQFDLKCSVV